jgi:ABC-type cobalamin/Fe3+-siderophores transport system ATPase subunit
MLRIENLKYKNILKDISLTFEKGKLYCIIGPNGAGKTSLLKNIAGIWKPTRGNVLWEGENLHKKTRKEISQTVSLLSQCSEVPFFDFTVREIVSMGKYSGKGDVEEELRKVDGWHLRNKSINRISSGERQRIFLARSMVTEAPLMLLDEPTSSLDIKHQYDIFAILQALKKEKIIIMSIHDIYMAEKISDEIILLDKGSSLGQGPYCRDKISEVFQCEL